MHKLLTGLSLLVMHLVVFGQRETPQQYIDQYKQLAIQEMKRSGVPAAITLAQGILESESGNSDLVKMSNNHFGIKCKSNWTGPTVTHDDDAPDECFRAYDQASESFKDHSDFLKSSSRYSSLFNLNPEDYKGWAYGLKKAGYATNPKYADILIASIEKFNLNQYTLEGMMEGVNSGEYRKASASSMSPEKMSDFPVGQSIDDLQSFRVNGLKAVNAPSGISLLAICTRFNIRLSKLVEWNELENDGLLDRPQIVYLEKKKKEGSQPFLTLNKDKTAYDVAQEEGIQSGLFCQYNGVQKNEILKAGRMVYLKPDVPKTEDGLGQLEKTTEKGQTIHIVEPKEGLYSISKRFGVTVAQLKSWNQIAGDNLQIGQKLIIEK